MNILLTGASGFVGGHLQQRLERSGHQVTPVSRRPGAGGVDWSPDGLRRGAEGADAIVHLAGENIFGRRWSAAQKARLLESRVGTARRLSSLAAELGTGCLISASAVGYYGPSTELGLDEDSPPGSDFLARLCREWEAAIEPAREVGVRTAVVRIGVVLGPGGGALARMLPPFRLGLGGPLGGGRQWVSWVHVDDLTALFQFLLEHPETAGCFNATAPNPVTMAELAQTLGRVLGRPAVLPVPALALRALLGGAASVLLTGQHVLPARARRAGFVFEHAGLEGALRNLLGAA